MWFLLALALHVGHGVACLPHQANCIRFKGGLLGVKADVELYRRASRAHIQLRGTPIGGLLSGDATYDRNYNVKLDESFSRALSRLRVNVLSVYPSEDWTMVFVQVQLPFFLGRHTIRLQRV